MHLYTKCRFCYAELAQPGHARKAFCNSDCKVKFDVYGNVYQWRKNKPKDKTPNRKTPRKQSPKQPKAAPEPKLVTIKPDTSKSKKKSAQRLVAVSVAFDNGVEIYQGIMTLQYPLEALPILTGRAITKKGEEK
jgi:hypothetical protein